MMLFVMTVLIGSGLLIKTVWASSFEWFTYFTVTGSSSGGVSIPFVTGTTSSTVWQVTTTGNYYEYRTLYWGANTDPSNPPTTWTEYTQCEHAGNINGSGPYEGCNFTIQSAPNSTYYWVRATTNYTSCGTYTPNPGSNCGDKYDFREAYR